MALCYYDIVAAAPQLGSLLTIAGVDTAGKSPEEINAAKLHVLGNNLGAVLVKRFEGAFSSPSEKKETIVKLMLKLFEAVLLNEIHKSAVLAFVLEKELQEDKLILQQYFAKLKEMEIRELELSYEHQVAELEELEEEIRQEMQEELDAYLDTLHRLQSDVEQSSEQIELYKINKNEILALIKVASLEIADRLIQDTTPDNPFKCPENIDGNEQNNHRLLVAKLVDDYIQVRYEQEKAEAKLQRLENELAEKIRIEHPHLAKEIGRGSLVSFSLEKHRALLSSHPEFQYYFDEIPRLKAHRDSEEIELFEAVNDEFAVLFKHIEDPKVMAAHKIQALAMLRSETDKHVNDLISVHKSKWREHQKIRNKEREARHIHQRTEPLRKKLLISPQPPKHKKSSHKSKTDKGWVAHSPDEYDSILEVIRKKSQERRPSPQAPQHRHSQPANR